MTFVISVGKSLQKRPSSPILTSVTIKAKLAILVLCHVLYYLLAAPSGHAF